MRSSIQPKSNHDGKDFKIRWSISLPPVILFLIILAAGLMIPDTFNKALDAVVMFIMKDMGWFISLSTLFFVGFVVVIMFHPIGKIKLGGPNAKPELSTFEYFASSVTLATGFILWPAAEMLEYSARPPRAFGQAAGSYQAIIDALKFEWVHWAITQFSLYAAFAIVVGYAFYNLHKPYTTSSALYPLFGEKMGKKGKNLIDMICLFAIVGGVIGSLGYGLLQIGSSLEYLFNLKTGMGSWIMIVAAIILVCTAAGLINAKKGFALLGKTNTYLFIVFLAAVLIFGPKSFIFNLISEAFGQFIRDYIPILTVQDFMPGSDLWAQWWNNIWWLDWIGFAPLSGMFIANLSKGRTIREMIVFNMVLPSVFAIIWFGILGGYAANLQYVLGIDLLSVLDAHGHSYMQIFTMSFLPIGSVIKILLLVSQLIANVILVNSMSSTVAMMSIIPGKGYTKDEAPLWIKVFWCILMAVIAILFIASGGLAGAKSVKAIAGFPIFILELGACIGFILFFMKGKAPEKIHVAEFTYANLNEETGELDEVKA